MSQRAHERHGLIDPEAVSTMDTARLLGISPAFLRSKIKAGFYAGAMVTKTRFNMYKVLQIEFADRENKIADALAQSKPDYDVEALINSEAISSSQLAGLLQVSNKTITLRKQAGRYSDAQVGDTTFNLAKVIEIELKLSGDKTPQKISDERAELLKVTRQQKELQLAQANELVAPVLEFEDGCRDIAVLLRREIKNMGGRFAAELAQMTEASEVKALLEDEAARILGMTADRLDEYADVEGAFSTRDVGNNQGSASPDAGRLGRGLSQDTARSG